MTDPLAPTAPVRKPGFIYRAIVSIAGVDQETLRQCPAHDWDAARAIGLLMIGVWVYQSALFAIVAHQFLAPDGRLHPALIIASMFIAAMILLLDSVLFVRAGFHADGIRELARAGLDLSGGFGVKLTAGIFLGLRILLALAFAQLSAIFFSLILYHGDVAANVQHQYQQQNGALIAAASRRVDDDIHQTAAAVDGAQRRVDALQRQADLTLRYLRGPLPWRNWERARTAQAMLPDLERNLQAATATLAALRKELAARINGRDAAIQQAIQQSPARMDATTGILAQMRALRRLASDPEILFVIILIDLVSFGLETAAVLAKTTTFIPTTYAALLARNAYARVVAIVDELDEMTNRRGPTEQESRAPGSTPRPSDRPTNVTWFPTAHGQNGLAAPGRRPRGRPRKDGLNGPSPSPTGKDKHNPEEDDEGQ